MDRSQMRRQISDTYAGLLAKMPEDRITVKLLTQECGFSRQTFYYYFKDIPDVAEYTLLRIFDEVTKNCCAQEHPTDAIHIFLEALETHKLLIRRLLNSPHSRSFLKYMAKGMAKTVAMVLENGYPSYHCVQDDKDFLSDFLSYGILGYCFDQLEENKEMDIEKLTDQIYRLLRGRMISWNNG